MSGSLDAQYVEFTGVVTAVQTNLVTLLTSGGIGSRRAAKRGKRCAN